MDRVFQLFSRRMGKSSHLKKVRELSSRTVFSSLTIDTIYHRLWFNNKPFQRLTFDARWKFIEQSLELSLATMREPELVASEQWELYKWGLVV